jgi:Domain of unknown function (DUF4157)
VELSGATRRFLEPLVGFDPGDVDVLRGDTATEFTRQLGADAAAVEGGVVLRDTANLESPEQLGLLAHELIHVPQQRRFVSPKVTHASTAPVVGDTAASSWTSEEDRARLAEARVTRLAREAPLSQTPLSEVGSETSSVADRWQGLPAPWEPMPNLSFDAPNAPSGNNVISLVGAGTSASAWGDAASAAPVSSTSVTAPASSGMASTSSGAASLADEGRSLPSAEGGESGGAGGGDIDGLARQVYEVLKRKLRQERSRGGL